MNKNTKILLIILIMVISGLFVFKRGLVSKNVNPLNQEKELLFSGLDIDKIDQIIIKQDNEETVLQKKADNWQRKEATQSAEKNKIETLLQTVKDMEKQELASQNRDKRDVYQVTENATQVILKSGDQEAANFYIGKRGPDFLSTYVRKKDSDNVWLIKKALEPIFEPDTWQSETSLEKVEESTPAAELVPSN